MVNPNFKYTQLTTRDVSFQLARTNPKLTTNLKLTVDSDGLLWFNSIDATNQLANQQYKKFAINPNSSHEINIHRFYDMGNTPTSIAYSIGTSIAKDVTAKDLKDQYDFDFYTSGAKYLTSRQYSEKFAYFAPIYLDKVLPTNFVIFKIPGASNYTAGEGKLRANQSTAQFATDLFENATILKVFDLSPSSNIGKYLNGIYQNPMFNSDPLYVNYQSGGYSLYRGVSISAGTYVELPENLDTIFAKSLPLLKVEQYITNGFERNGIIHPRILNLEFLFDDDASDPYTFNRYVGFYCNAIDLETLEIDLDSMYSVSSTEFEWTPFTYYNTHQLVSYSGELYSIINPGTSGIVPPQSSQVSDPNITGATFLYVGPQVPDNDQNLPIKYQRSDDISFELTNNSGVTLRAKKIGQNLSDISLNRTSSDSLFFPYLKTKDNSLYLISPNGWNQTGDTAIIKLDNTKFDLGQTFGPRDLFAQEDIIQSITNTRATLKIDLIQKPAHLDTLRIYHPTGTKFDTDGHYDDLVFVSGVFTSTQTVNGPSSNPITISEEEYSLHYINGVSQIYINLDIDLADITKAICDIVLNLKNSSIFGLTIQNSAFIQVRNFGDMYGELKAKSIPVDLTNSIELNNSLTTSIVWADGGFYNQAHPLLPVGNAERILPLLDDIVVKTYTNWSQISRITNCVDFIKADLSIDGETQAIDSYSKYEVLMLTDNEIVNTNYNRIELRKIFKPTVGVLSLFEIKDFDFTTYSTSYSKNLVLDLYKDYYVPPNTAILDFTNFAYQVIGTGEIQINGISYTEEDQYVWQFGKTSESYSIITGDPILIKSNISVNLIMNDPDNPTLGNETLMVNGDKTNQITRLDLSYFDEDGDAKNYIGPFTLKAYHATQDQNLKTFPYREKFNYGNVASEYLANLENYFADFAIDGRVTPYITKWGIIDSTDARDNPYRLNSELVFGEDNFGPSPNETSPTPEKITHEWFYIESSFDFIKDPNLIKQNFSYFEKPIDISKLIVNPDYFEEYFTYIPMINGVELNRPQYRYSILTRNEFSGQYETIFKGAKFVFSELDIFGKSLSSTTRFENYKFSAILKPIPENPNVKKSPVNYRVIENTQGKTITLIIELTIGWLGEMPNLVISEFGGFENYDYGNDIELTGFNYISQETLLHGSFFFNSLPTTYQLNNLFLSLPVNTYNAMINGNIPIQLNGTTISDGDIVLLSSTSGSTSIVATENSQLYIDYLAGQITTGDLLDGQHILSVKTSQAISASGDIYESIVINFTGSILSEFSITHKILYLDSVNGDYRINFNSDGVSNLTHSFLYYAKNKKYNSKKGSFSTIKLSKGIDLSQNGILFNNGLPSSIKPIDLVDVISYGSTANSEINSVVNNFAPLYIITSNKRQLLLQIDLDSTIDSSGLNKSLFNSGVVGATNQYILLMNTPNMRYQLVEPIITLSGSVQYSTQPIPFQSNGYWASSEGHFQIFGGEKYFEKIFENISFAKFISILENDSNLVSWESYTNGSNPSYQQISMNAIKADEIQKSTMIQINPISISYGKINAIAGFELTEVPTNQYSLFRYSGEYDAIFKSISGFKYSFSINGNDLTGSNSCINTQVDNFFNISEFEYIKYSQIQILDLENSQNYSAIYPYIGETPIDRTNFNFLSSSWDYNYHFEYSDKTNFTKIPGTRRLTEDYSFISKLINLPDQIIIEEFTSAEVSQVDYNSSNFTNNNLIYSQFDSTIKFKIDIQSIITQQLIKNGLNTEFQKFLVDETGSIITTNPEFLGELSLTDYITNYCYTNLTKLYQIGTFNFYELSDRTIPNNSIQFVYVTYDGLDYLGYSPAKSIQINNTKSTILEGTIQLNANAGLKIVPKIIINYI